MIVIIWQRAIDRPAISVFIAAVRSLSGWSFAHVGQEVLDEFLPYKRKKPTLGERAGINLDAESFPGALGSTTLRATLPSNAPAL
jgi:hypothetical protein